MFDAVLDLAGMEAGLESDLETETIDLHGALAEAFNMVIERARAKKITLEFDCALDIGWLEADAKKLRHCVLHLLGNAVTHTGNGGQISLAATHKKGWFEIQVADTGAGMKRRDIERMTKPFERGETTEPGAGLGLTLVDAFVRLQGGEMKISSAPSRGTRVTCRLPAAPVIP
jgi:signal transduction histidine kinase